MDARGGSALHSRRQGYAVILVARGEPAKLNVCRDTTVAQHCQPPSNKCSNSNSNSFSFSNCSVYWAAAAGVRTPLIKHTDEVFDTGFPKNAGPAAPSFRSYDDAKKVWVVGRMARGGRLVRVFFIGHRYPRVSLECDCSLGDLRRATDDGTCLVDVQTGVPASGYKLLVVVCPHHPNAVSGRAGHCIRF